MTGIAEKRKRFAEAFERLLTESETPELPSRSSPVWPEDPLIANWFSGAEERILTIQEADAGESVSFDFLIRRVGENERVADLVLTIKNSPSKASLALEIYKLWFVDEMPEERIDPLLEEFVKAYG